MKIFKERRVREKNNIVDFKWFAIDAMENVTTELFFYSLAF